MTSHAIVTMDDWPTDLWPKPVGQHWRREDHLRAAISAETLAGLRACTAAQDGVACGWCHNCGAATGDLGSCLACGCSDADE